MSVSFREQMRCANLHNWTDLSLADQSDNPTHSLLSGSVAYSNVFAVFKGCGEVLSDEQVKCRVDAVGTLKGVSLKCVRLYLKGLVKVKLLVKVNGLYKKK